MLVNKKNLKMNLSMTSMLLVMQLFALLIAVRSELFHYDESIIEDILENYDRRILPTQNGSAVKVAVRVNIFDMAEQKTIHSHYSIEIVVHSVWNDFRLAFNSSVLDDLRLVGSKIDLIWTPDFTFEEKIGIASKVTTDNKFAAISSNGDVLFSQRVILTLFCVMDFRRFPFDDQHCHLPILSFAYNNEQLQLDWLLRNNGRKLEAVTFLGDLNYVNNIFKVEEYSYVKKEREFDGSEIYDELVINFTFHRHISYYLVRIYMPLILIVVMSFAAFWIDYRSTPARTIMATTIVLTVVTFIVSIQGSLPPTTSIRSIDIYYVCCFIFVFAALVEFAFVQTVDIQVKIIERRLKQLKGSEVDDDAGNKKNNNGQVKTANGKAHSAVTPVFSVGEIPEIRIHGIFGKLLTKVYREHVKHREAYHVLDYYAKRAFPLTFITLNIIYFAVYSSHF